MKRNKIFILFGIIFILYLIIISLSTNHIDNFKNNINLTGRHGIIFTCSTFFDFKTGDRWNRFCRAIDTLKEYHTPEIVSQINSWIVINEYSENSSIDWSSKVKERYPWIDFYQKGSNEKGQARTMNIILKKIKDTELWIHWEEAWEVRASFLDDAIKAMRNDPSIIQLQFTYHNNSVNWLNIDSSRINCMDRVCKIIPVPDSNQVCKTSPYTLTNEYFSSWPLYSLLPSINRAEHYKNIGDFSEDPKLWPVKFEWEFGCRWLKAGGTKAILKDGPVWRPGTHVSTYN